LLRGEELLPVAFLKQMMHTSWWIHSLGQTFGRLMLLALLVVLLVEPAGALAEEGILTRALKGEKSDDSSSPSDFLVQGLDEIEPAFAEYPGSMYSGLLPVDHDDVTGELMFWLFAPHKVAPPLHHKKTLTIWLNGGPGCSSFFAGVFFEHGPVTVPLQPAGSSCCSDPHAPLVYNPHTWAESTHMLYVEQPVSVGFSRGRPRPNNETQVAADFAAFLQSFYNTFTQYRDYELYIFGESYAGMYVPSIAHYIHQRNQATDAAAVMPLAGVGIGNGLLDSRVQGPIRIDYAFFHDLIDQHTRENLHRLWNVCIGDSNDDENQQQQLKEPFHPFNVPDDCGMLSAIPLAAGRGVGVGNGPNVYDVTTWDPYAVLVGDDNSISRFYNNPAVKAKLHAPTDKFWQGCLPGAGRRRRQLLHRRLETSLLIHDEPVSTVPYIADLLDGGVRVLM